MFTKPQDVLTRTVKTIHDVNVPWEFKNEAEPLAQNRAKFNAF